MSEVEAGNEAGNGTEAVRRGERRVAIASVVTMVAIIIAAVLVVMESRREDDRREDDRVERTIEACLQYNKDRTDLRDFGESSIDALGRLTGQTHEDIVERVGQAALDEYNAFVADTFPYRQCTIECVDAYLSSDMKDCPPAKNEDGTT